MDPEPIKEFFRCLFIEANIFEDQNNNAVCLNLLLVDNVELKTFLWHVSFWGHSGGRTCSWCSSTCRRCLAIGGWEFQSNAALCCLKLRWEIPYVGSDFRTIQPWLLPLMSIHVSRLEKLWKPSSRADGRVGQCKMHVTLRCWRKASNQLMVSLLTLLLLQKWDWGMNFR